MWCGRTAEGRNIWSSLPANSDGSPATRGGSLYPFSSGIFDRFLGRGGTCGLTAISSNAVLLSWPAASASAAGQPSSLSSTLARVDSLGAFNELQSSPVQSSMDHNSDGVHIREEKWSSDHPVILPSYFGSTTQTQPLPPTSRTVSSTSSGSASGGASNSLRGIDPVQDSSESASAVENAPASGGGSSGPRSSSNSSGGGGGTWEGKQQGRNSRGPSLDSSSLRGGPFSLPGVQNRSWDDLTPAVQNAILGIVHGTSTSQYVKVRRLVLHASNAALCSPPSAFQHPIFH